MVETFLGDTAFVKEYLLVTKISLLGALEELGGHVRAHNFDGVRFTAHKLKGVAAYASLTKVHQLAAELERIQPESPRTPSETFRELEGAVARAISLLQNALDRP